MHSLKRAQITYLKANKASSKVPSKDADFVNIFSPKLLAKLPEHTKINVHAIKLVNNQQPPYSPIYSLDPVKLEILKLTLKIIWSTNLSGLLSHLPEHLFSLTRSQTIV